MLKILQARLQQYVNRESTIISVKISIKIFNWKVHYLRVIRVGFTEQITES